MEYVINNINGKIRIKIPNLKLACSNYNITFIEPNYNIESYNPYLAGLIDTKGTIVFNYSSNRIECNIELKYNEFSSKLNLDNVIPNYKPNVRKIIRKGYKSILFSYQTVENMIFLYEYVMKNRLYCDMKFYRVSQIKRFIEIRKYNKYDFKSPEFLVYSNFLINFIKYQNPS